MELSTFEPMQVTLRLVGAFYAFAGFIVARATLTSRFLDRAIAAIALEKPKKTETARAVWLLTQSFVILAGGASLILLLHVSAWLFAAASLGQAVYLFHIAPRYFDVEDPPESRGRTQTRDAFVVYLAATAFVGWAALTGRLVALDEVPWQLLAFFGAVVVGYAAMTTWQFVRPFKSAHGALGALTGEDAVPPAPHPSDSRRIKVMADHGTEALWAMDDGLYGDFAPEEIGLSPDLARDLTQWLGNFGASVDWDDPGSGSRWSDDQWAAHEQAARRLAVRIARELPERTVYYHTRDQGVLEVSAADEA